MVFGAVPLRRADRPPAPAALLTQRRRFAGRFDLVPLDPDVIPCPLAAPHERGHTVQPMAASRALGEAGSSRRPGTRSAPQACLRLHLKSRLHAECRLRDYALKKKTAQAKSSNSHFGVAGAFGVHALACPSLPSTLKRELQTSEGAKMRTAEPNPPDLARRQKRAVSREGWAALS